jgi:prepilin-type N-terminal cleavage/methylation domain-containing protein
MPIAPRSARSQAGFSFIEILVVMGIITLLTSMVVMVIPWIRERGNQTKSKDNVSNLVKLMLDMSMHGKEKGYPVYNGKNFTLSPLAYQVIDVDAPGALEVFFSPSDEHYKLSLVDVAKYRGVTRASLKQGDSYKEYTSYAGRLNRETECRMAPSITSQAGTIMLCDDDDGPLHHSSGLIVGFRDGLVQLMDWEDLGMAKPKDAKNPDPFLGESAQGELLKCMSSQ